MTIVDSIILGIVEGLTELLPISSTGHLILVERLLGIPQTEFLKSFNIAIQLGAIFAVGILYFRSFFQIELVKRLIVAFIPTGLIGLAVYPYVRGYLMGNELVVVGALFLGGIALVVFEHFHREKDDALASPELLPYRHAVLLGLFQSIAIIPGVSRSAATILGGLLLGMKRTAIVEFSFLLAAPTMAVATGYDLLRNTGALGNENLLLLAVGFFTSFVVALFAMKFLLAWVRTHSFTPFGVYRIVIAILFFLFVIR